jgi:O-antigen ligase
MKNKLATYAPFILVGVYPLGMAVQNIGAVLALLFLLPTAMENRTKISQLNIRAKSYLGLILTLIGVSMLATILNETNVEPRFGKYIGGYIGFILLPILFYLQPKRLIFENKEKLFKVFVYGTVFMALVCISQKIWGWQISGSSMVFSEGAKRPRGLYSHPLTCAYVALVFWPIGVGRILDKPKKLLSWLLIISLTIVLILTSSRTVQAVCVLTMGLQIFVSLRGKSRILAIGLVLSLLAGVTFTKNPVSERFKSTLTHQSAMRAKGYPDDRVAFWHVFWTMIKEKPVLGHGIDLNTKYRTPYYEGIGLGEFKKKYSAHNMFIQVTAESGFVGLSIFCAFLLSMLNLFLYSFRENWIKVAAGLMLLGFVVAALTQNAIQDSIVKNAILIWVVCAFDMLSFRDEEKA